MRLVLNQLVATLATQLDLQCLREVPDRGFAAVVKMAQLTNDLGLNCAYAAIPHIKNRGEKFVARF